MKLIILINICYKKYYKNIINYFTIINNNLKKKK